MNEPLPLVILAAGWSVSALALLGIFVFWGAAGLTWAKNNIVWQTPARRRRPHEGELPPIVNEIRGIVLNGLLSPDPSFTFTMVLTNYSGSNRKIASIDGFIHCAEQLCNDKPVLVSPLTLRASAHDSWNCHIRQQVKPAMVNRIIAILATPDGALGIDLNNIKLEGSYLTTRHFTVRGPIRVEEGSPDLDDIIPVNAVLVSQQHYDQLGRTKSAS